MTQENQDTSHLVGGAGGGRAGAGRVLIVEDDPVTLRVLGQVLENAQYPVVMADSGSEGLRVLRADRKVRLVLLDLEMPHLSGWEFRRTQRADSRLAAVPTVIITGTPLENIEDGQLRAADYLLKPVDPDHLISVVAKYCGRLFT
jgi:CheY-like chemotaxis protein